jgi:hypothetical protein
VRRDDGEILLVLTALTAAVALAGAVLGHLALAVALRTSAQSAADAAALAAAGALRAAVIGGDGARWDCAPGAAADLRSAAAEVAAAGGAALAAVRRDGCDVVATVRSAHRLADGVTVSSRARVSPGSRPGTGPHRVVAVPGAPVRQGTLLAALVSEADRIDRLGLPYVWGGGHQSSPAPPNGPFDCSGAVSRVLQAIGYPIPTMVSRDFMRIGAPGPGRVTIWAYDGHVFMTIAGRGWGTGATARGGAGWLPYAAPYHSRFVARHLPELEHDDVVDLSGLDLGSILLGAPGGPPTIGLVPLAG